MTTPALTAKTGQMSNTSCAAQCSASAATRMVRAKRSSCCPIPNGSSPRTSSGALSCGGTLGPFLTKLTAQSAQGLAALVVLALRVLADDLIAGLSRHDMWVLVGPGGAVRPPGPG